MFRSVIDLHSGIGPTHSPDSQQVRTFVGFPERITFFQTMRIHIAYKARENRGIPLIARVCIEPVKHVNVEDAA